MIEVDDDNKEWDTIACLPILNINKEYREEFVSSREVDFVNVDQLDTYFFNTDLDDQMTNITIESKSTTILSILKAFFFMGPSSLNSAHLNERNRIFAFTNQTFDNRNRFHIQCLYTVFSKLTGNVFNGFKRFGHHWEDIGFQGTDPATDFRGVGVLGLLQLTYFVVNPSVMKHCKEIYELSLHSEQHFPFAITSMNITQISLQVMREGLLNKFINETGSALKIFNQFYYGTFIKFFTIWKNDKKTIVDIGFVLKDLRRLIRKNIKKILYDFHKIKTYCEYVDSKNENEEFTNIVNVE